MFKDKKNIIILLLITLLIVSVIICILLFTKNEDNISTSNFTEKNIDGSKLSSAELIKMFNNEGYEFRLTTFTDSSGIYIILENKVEGIKIQRIVNTLVGTLMTYDDNSVNSEMADLIKIGENDTKEKKEQYKAYESWMKKYNITKTQLSNMLDYYYTNNKNKIEIINIDELLNY